MKTAIQHTTETPKGCRLFTPKLFTESEKACLKVLSLEVTRELIDTDLSDFEDERVRVHLENAKTEMTQAIYYAEGLR